MPHLTPKKVFSWSGSVPLLSIGSSSSPLYESSVSLPTQQVLLETFEIRKVSNSYQHQSQFLYLTNKKTDPEPLTAENIARPQNPRPHHDQPYALGPAHSSVPIYSHVETQSSRVLVILAAFTFQTQAGTFFDAFQTSLSLQSQRPPPMADSPL